MSLPDQHHPCDREPKRDELSLHQIIDQANQAIEGSQAQIARSRALSQSEADLAREIDRIVEENGASQGHGGGS
ncbi:hypothetical protein JKG68_17590 [Microvirga aerilata]|uniref:Uncharacterized protein n=1 Tax=Microvirga aerilata TaxID=670292 RepID=A0A936ZA24_9HYPH|nr:hypothetical protein [Microvirga aerilata]MBL0405776.1 hypothetical protein [Microvirga aerilata]